MPQTRGALPTPSAHSLPKGSLKRGSVTNARSVSAREELAFGEITPDGAAWRVRDLALAMAGRWDITLRVAREGHGDEALVVTHIR